MSLGAVASGRTEAARDTRLEGDTVRLVRLPYTVMESDIEAFLLEQINKVL